MGLGTRGSLLLLPLMMAGMLEDNEKLTKRQGVRWIDTLSDMRIKEYYRLMQTGRIRYQLKNWQKKAIQKYMDSHADAQNDEA